ncbi:MAG TPA: helix-turn-helix transcriptional regulator [Candidatus Enterosoma merdigallinarum]|jgi:DNA-binding XRE family transcriptional regulator|nr:helix-turn-helix transcriptional regulator [Candidatus Enterosoma merdigallinarum]
MFDYARKIREYRERKFISQQELAKILGVSNVTVCRWETGRYEPDMETKKKLVALFNEIGMKLDD